MAILIKRYANRKLYNTEASRYITLKGIAELLEEGEEVRVVDNETGEDITSVALSQILVDSERKNSAVPRSLLSQIVERGGDALYGALRRGIDDASGGFEDLQDRMRRIVHTEGGGPGPDPIQNGPPRGGGPFSLGRLPSSGFSSRKSRRPVGVWLTFGARCE